MRKILAVVLIILTVSAGRVIGATEKEKALEELLADVVVKLTEQNKALTEKIRSASAVNDMTKKWVLEDWRKSNTYLVEYICDKYDEIPK